MKPKEMVETLVTCIKNNMPVLLKGSPGIGKTDIVKQAARIAGADLIVTHPVVSDPTDYKGMPFMKDGVAEFMPFGDLRKLINATEKTIFFTDDLGQAPQSVQAAVMQLILARRINGFPVSDQVVFMAATNRHTDRAGVSGILEPVKSRFMSILELEVDLEDWVVWALAHNLPVPLIAFIRFRPELLHNFKPTIDLTNSPCPRTVAHVGAIVDAKFPGNVEYEMISGATGEGFASEFIGFLKVWREIPLPSSILNDPDSATIPHEPATLYALTGALARIVLPDQMGNLMKYLTRLDQGEFTVLCLRDATRRDENLMSTPEFIKWVAGNSDFYI